MIIQYSIFNHNLDSLQNFGKPLKIPIDLIAVSVSCENSLKNYCSTDCQRKLSNFLKGDILTKKNLKAIDLPNSLTKRYC